MYILFKKVPKSIENKKGSRKIEENENPFESPCLLCLSAQDMDKQVFGITKHYMSIAGIRVRNDKSAKFDLRDFPVNFLSIKYQRDEKEETEEKAADKFVDKYFIPLLENSKTQEEKMKKFRNINIMSYCNGTQRAVDIISNLREKMEKRGYSNEEINSIVSQISLITLSTEISYIQTGATCVDFHDTKDTEVNNGDYTWISELDEKIGNIEKDEQRIEECFEISSKRNSGMYCIEGTGAHTVHQFHTEGTAMPVCLSKIVHNMLENSILNARENEFTPLTIKELTDGCSEIFQKANEGKTLEELREDLYKNMKYTGGMKLTNRECKLLDELDNTYDLAYKQEDESKRDKKIIDGLNEKNARIMEAVQESSTEETYKKVLLAQGWQFDKEEEKQIKETDTDKEIIEKQKEKIKKLQLMLNKTLEFAQRVRRSRFGRFFFRNDLKQLPRGEEEKEK